MPSRDARLGRLKNPSVKTRLGSDSFRREESSELLSEFLDCALHRFLQCRCRLIGTHSNGVK